MNFKIGSYWNAFVTELNPHFGQLMLMQERWGMERNVVNMPAVTKNWLFFSFSLLMMQKCAELWGELPDLQLEWGMDFQTYKTDLIRYCLIIFCVSSGKCYTHGSCQGHSGGTPCLLSATRNWTYWRVEINLAHVLSLPLFWLFLWYWM